jgi:hypothetical protein
METTAAAVLECNAHAAMIIQAVVLLHNTFFKTTFNT